MASHPDELRSSAETETEPILNLIMGNSEWVVSKSMKWNGILKPKSEPVPNRISERRLPECGVAVHRMLLSFIS